MRLLHASWLFLKITGINVCMTEMQKTDLYSKKMDLNTRQAELFGVINLRKEKNEILHRRNQNILKWPFSGFKNEKIGNKMIFEDLNFVCLSRLSKKKGKCIG